MDDVADNKDNANRDTISISTGDLSVNGPGMAAVGTGITRPIMPALVCHSRLPDCQTPTSALPPIHIRTVPSMLAARPTSLMR